MAWLTEIEKAYLAGILDGEASFSIKKRTKGKPHRIAPEYRVVITITNTSKDLIDFIVSKIKTGSGYFTSVKRSRNPNRKDTFEIQVRDKTAEKLIKEIFPYLIVKKKQAEVILRLRETFNKRYTRWNPVPPVVNEIREECYKMIKVLNKRGKY